MYIPNLGTEAGADNRKSRYRKAAPSERHEMGRMAEVVPLYTKKSVPETAQPLGTEVSVSGTLVI